MQVGDVSDLEVIVSGGLDEKGMQNLGPLLRTGRCGSAF
jgi:hypothetical protein